MQPRVTAGDSPTDRSASHQVTIGDTADATFAADAQPL